MTGAMSLSGYQQAAAATAIYPADRKVIYPTLGLAGEAGELSNKVKKVLRDRDGNFESPEFRDAIVAELGDVLWYVAAVASDLGVSLQHVAEANIAKLQSRAERKCLRGDGDHR